MKEMVYGFRDIEILDHGIYSDHEYVIKSLGGLWPCAYVKLNQDDCIFKQVISKFDHDGQFGNEDLIENLRAITMHGGCTYFRDYLIIPDDKIVSPTGYWIGWDYGHLGDYTYGLEDGGRRWTTLEIREEVFNVIEQINSYNG